ncbi:MAG: thioester domain-containing protein [Vallitaleaceae bacterium]|nr:thioester domain-containing protein [Vallitaleaceae bacterium]
MKNYKLKKKVSLVISSILIMSLLISTSAFGADYKWNQEPNGYEQGDDTYDAFVFNLFATSSGKLLQAYCLDYETFIMEDAVYDRITALGNSNNEQKVRAILGHSYPYLSLSEIQDDLDEAGVVLDNPLSEGVLITATQYAVWFYTNGTPMYSPVADPDITTLYNYFKDLNPLESPDEYEAIITSPSYGRSGGVVTLNFDYYIQLSDGTKVDTEDLDVALTYNKTILTEDFTTNADLSVSVVLTVSESELPANENFRISLEGVLIEAYEMTGSITELVPIEVEEEEEEEEVNEDESNEEEGSGDEGTGDEGTGDESTGEEGNGDEGTEEEGNGDEGTEEEGNGDEGEDEGDIAARVSDDSERTFTTATEDEAFEEVIIESQDLVFADDEEITTYRDFSYTRRNRDRDPDPDPDPDPEPEPEPEPEPDEIELPDEIVEIPEAVPTPEEIILDEVVVIPQALPETSGTPIGLLMLLGTSVSGLGLYIKKQNK